MANPLVKIRPVRRGGFISNYVVWCMTGDCEFADVAGVKTGAQTMQREHARKHRHTGGPISKGQPYIVGETGGGR